MTKYNSHETTEKLTWTVTNFRPDIVYLERLQQVLLSVAEDRVHMYVLQDQAPAGVVTVADYVCLSSDVASSRRAPGRDSQVGPQEDPRAPW